MSIKRRFLGGKISNTKKMTAGKRGNPNKMDRLNNGLQLQLGRLNYKPLDGTQWERTTMKTTFTSLYCRLAKDVTSSWPDLSRAVSSRTFWRQQLDTPYQGPLKGLLLCGRWNVCIHLFLCIKHFASHHSSKTVTWNELYYSQRCISPAPTSLSAEETGMKTKPKEMHRVHCLLGKHYVDCSYAPRKSVYNCYGWLWIFPFVEVSISQL